MYKIDHISKKDLPRIEHLLRNSFEGTFDLSDEIDCFESMPTSSWFYLSDEKDDPRAFIRCFPMEENLFSGELYAEPSKQREVFIRALLIHFKKHCDLSFGQQVRFVAEIGDQTIIEALRKTFPNSAIDTYFYYSKSIRDEKIIEHPTFLLKDEHSLQRLRSILFRLNDYPFPKLIDLMESNKLVVYKYSGILVSVLHYEPKGLKTCEIITLATAKDSLRKGYGAALLKKFFSFASSQFNTIILKVEENNLPAIGLYEMTGFQRVEEKTEQWWYVDSKQRT